MFIDDGQMLVLINNAINGPQYVGECPQWA